MEDMDLNERARGRAYEFWQAAGSPLEREGERPCSSRVQRRQARRSEGCLKEAPVAHEERWLGSNEVTEAVRTQRKPCDKPLQADQHDHRRDALASATDLDRRIVAMVDPSATLTTRSKAFSLASVRLAAPLAGAGRGRRSRRRGARRGLGHGRGYEDKGGGREDRLLHE